LAIERPHKEAGFTLVEVLCVLALLGLTTGLVVLNLPKPAPAFEKEATGVTTLLNLAARESVIDGKSRDLADRTKAKAKENADLPPLIYFDATGNVTPFTLSLEGRDDSFTLEPNARGRIIMETTP